MHAAGECFQQSNFTHLFFAHFNISTNNKHMAVTNITRQRMLEKKPLILKNLTFRMLRNIKHTRRQVFKIKVFFRLALSCHVCHRNVLITSTKVSSSVVLFPCLL